MHSWKRFWNIENEILVPFMTVGILVLCAFGFVSFYSSYQLKLDYERSYAEERIIGVNRGINRLSEIVSEAQLRMYYEELDVALIEIRDAEGELIYGSDLQRSPSAVLLDESSENQMNWSVACYLDEKEFWENLFVEQRYVVVAAIAALLLLMEACVIIARSLSAPIRSMGNTCVLIEQNKEKYRTYRFQAASRSDEIGQLAKTFQKLLSDVEGHTKAVYTNQMASALAHEIRNPIAGIRSGLQVLQGRASKNQDGLLYDAMIHEIDRVTALVANLLVLSVKKNSVKSNVKVRTLMNELLLLYQNEANREGVEFQCQIKSELQCQVNENELRQICHNLISNSLKALQKVEGEKKICISGWSEGGWCILEFADTGIGMSGEELSKAREWFYTKSVNGIGLGLSIVEKLVENNGGMIDIESQEQAGTCVRLRFEE